MDHALIILSIVLLLDALRRYPGRALHALLISITLVLLGATPAPAASNIARTAAPGVVGTTGLAQGAAALPAGVGNAALRRLFPEPHPYLHDPVGWIQDVLGEHPWSAQQDILRSVVANRRTAVPACHGPGKSYIASRLIAWWLCTHDPGDAFVVWTAPRWPQVNKIIGRELRKLAKRHPHLGIRVTQQCEVYIAGEEGGYGRKPADTDEHGFQGIHARYVLVVGDEATGLVETMLTGMSALLTNADCRMLLLGNPDDPASKFHDACRPGSGYNVIRISALTTPNFTKELVAPYPDVRLLMEEHGIPYSTEYVPDGVRVNLVDPLWVHEAMRDWGKGTATFTSKVLGVFPKVSKDTLITPAMITHALNHVDLSGMKKGQYGADIARYGPDRTVVYRNRGGQIRFRYMCGQQSTDTTAGELRVILDETPDVAMVMDSVGIGGPVFDFLIADGYALIGFGDKGSLKDSSRFVDARSELYFTAREMFSAGLIDLDPDDPHIELLTAELQEHRYFHTRDGRIRVESKDELKKRLGRSPDFSDAFVYSLIDADADLSAFEDAADQGPASISSEFTDRIM